MLQNDFIVEFYKISINKPLEISIFFVVKVKRNKLDKKKDLGNFISYSLFSKDYRIFQPQSDKIRVTRDIQFYEDDQWEWNDESRVKNNNSL